MIAIAALCATSSIFALTGGLLPYNQPEKHGVIEIDNATDRAVILQMSKVSEVGVLSGSFLVNANNRDSTMLYGYHGESQLLAGVTCGNREATPENFTFPLELKLSDKRLMPLSQFFTIKKDKNGHVKIRKMAD